MRTRMLHFGLAFMLLIILCSRKVTSQPLWQRLQDYPVQGIGVSSVPPFSSWQGQLQPPFVLQAATYPSGIGSVFVVTTTNDTGDGSFRKAIANANANPGPDLITFNIPPIGAKTLIPLSKLPNIVDPVTIDATTQPGYAGVPIIELNCMSMGPFQALDVFAPSTIKGLVINRLTGGTGIVLWEGSGGSVVEGNFFGTNLAGTVRLGNIFNGIISSSPNNRIGGTSPGARNLFSGQGNPPIALIQGANGNVILGNLIGTDVTGSLRLGNTEDGILIIFGASNDTIGGTTAAAKNVISASDAFSGIAIIGTGQTGTQGICVMGNHIGLDLSGNIALGNARHGIYIRHSPGNIIGWTTSGALNVISGNSLPGIQIDSVGATNNIVQGNIIGTRPNGMFALPNSKGIVLNEAPRNLIGGSASGARNLITGNSAIGIEITGAGATGNCVRGNYIGTSISGGPGPRNLSHGILISASQDTIGGLNPEDGNLIAYNTGAGVFVTDGTSNLIWNNRILLNAGLAIDLAPRGITVNDSLDPDAGANALQNFPLLDSAVLGNGTITIHGRLNSWRNAQYMLHFYRNAVADLSHFGEGDSIIGSAMVTTNDSGNVQFSATFTATVTSSHFITATASNALGNTSEFSQALCLADADGDGIMDCWETQGWGIDVNSDTVIDMDLYAMGARPFQKDLFVEVDAMTGLAPSDTAMQKVKTAFANSPPNINLHVQLDDTSLGLYSWSTNWWTHFFNIKKDTFGTAAERSSPNRTNILEAKRLIFRYCIFAYSHDTTTSSGEAEAIGSNDFMVTLGRWQTRGGTSDQRAGTFMHELGHTLGLRHGGSDNTNYKPNYISIMNYTWQTPLSWADTWRLDYSRAGLPALMEGSLSEQNGLGTPAGYPLVVNVPFSGPGRVFRYASSRPATAVDWDTSGGISTAPVSVDLNIFRSDLNPSPGQTLTGQDDWPVLLYNFRGTPGFIDAIHSRPMDEMSEMTYEDFLDLDSLPPPKPEHFIMDGQLDIEAVRLTSGNGIVLYAALRDGELYVATNSAQSQNADMIIFVTADNENPGIPAPWQKSGQVAAWDAFLADGSSGSSFGWYTAEGSVKRNNSKAARSTNLLEGVIDLGLTVGREPLSYILAVGKYQAADSGVLLSQAPPGDGDGDIEANGELFRYIPGVERYWYQTAGPASQNVFSLYATGPDEIYAGAVMGGYKTSDGGDSWTHLTSGLPQVRIFDFVHIPNGNVYAASDVGVYYSTNNGGTWQQRSNGMTDLEARVVMASPQGTLFAGTYFAGLHRSTDGGENWTLINNGLPMSGVRALALDSSGYLLAGTTTSGVYRSTDDGMSWVQTGMADPNARSLYVDRLGRIYYVKSSPSIVFRSADGGDSWVNILQTSMGIQEMGMDMSGRIYAATAEGVLLSMNDGVSWDDISEGVPGQSTWSLVITPNDNVYVGTFIAGVCRRLSSSITSVRDIPGDLPTLTSLYQNYPNPFNPKTDITFQISGTSHVTLKIYDILGREVATLVNEPKAPGRYEVSWDAGKMASGVYFYRLQAGVFSETKKLILLR